MMVTLTVSATSLVVPTREGTMFVTWTEQLDHGPVQEYHAL